MTKANCLRPLRISILEANCIPNEHNQVGNAITEQGFSLGTTGEQEVNYGPTTQVKNILKVELKADG